MKKLLLLTILPALLALAPVPAKTIKQLIDLGGVGRCTAWSYGKGRWVTANHCTVHPELLPLEVIKRDAEVDLALVRGEVAKALPIAAVEPKLLERVYVLGFPGGQPFFYAFPAHVVSFTEEKISDPDLTLKFIVVPDVGISGMSGSPALNENGEVFGILHAGGDYQGVNLAGISRLDVLRKFLKGVK
jgi:hypothetical protein